MPITSINGYNVCANGGILFDRCKFDFEGIFWKLYDTMQLDRLNEKHEKQFEVGMDSSTSFHQKFYDKYRSGWPMMELMYALFIREVVAPLFDEDFLFQAFPTVRFHLPDHVAVGAFHNDGEFHHPDGEINYIIPLTNSDDTASVWVESEPGKKDFTPMKMRVGELIQFDGNHLTHGNKKNETGKTRVSMDFRVLPLSKYNPENEGESMTRKTKFTEGQYYKRFTK